MHCRHFARTDAPVWPWAATAAATRGLLQGDAGHPGSLDALLGKSASEQNAAFDALLSSAPINLAALETLEPLQRPIRIICVGLNYRDHAAKAVGLSDAVRARFLEAGDVIVTGTPSGVGAAREPPVFMKPGHICEIEIEKIGVLRNPIVDESRAERAPRQPR